MLCNGKSTCLVEQKAAGLSFAWPNIPDLLFMLHKNQYFAA